jgi:hypothetical protein
MKGRRSFGTVLPVTLDQRGLAERRTEFLVNRLIDLNMPLKAALASAYLQGIIDAAETVRAPNGQP